MRRRPGVLGLLLPAGVWQGEERFGPGLAWTLPVDCRRHALARVPAGWVRLTSAVLGRGSRHDPGVDPRSLLIEVEAGDDVGEVRRIDARPRRWREKASRH